MLATATAYDTHMSTRRAHAALFALGLAACTTITELPNDPDEGGGGSSSSAPTTASTSASTANTSGGGGAAACEVTVDWKVTVPFDEFAVDVLALGEHAGAVELLSANFLGDDGWQLMTTRIDVDGPEPILSMPVARGSLLHGIDSHARWTVLPLGGYEIHTAGLVTSVPPGEGPASITTLEGKAHLGWDRAGGRYVARWDETVEVELPDGSLVELGEIGPPCFPPRVVSNVGDGVVVRFGEYCDEPEDDDPRTIFVGPSGAHEVDLLAVSRFGRGAGDRALGVGFLGHVYEIGANGELGQLVAPNPWDGDTPAQHDIEVVPWLDGFAVVAAEQFSSDQRGIRVRAFPGYGERVESEFLSSSVIGTFGLMATKVDAAGRLIVAFLDDGLVPSLARLSCNVEGT